MTDLNSNFEIGQRFFVICIHDYFAIEVVGKQEISNEDIQFTKYETKLLTGAEEPRFDNNEAHWDTYYKSIYSKSTAFGSSIFLTEQDAAKKISQLLFEEIENTMRKLKSQVNLLEKMSQVAGNEEDIKAQGVAFCEKWRLQL